MFEILSDIAVERLKLIFPSEEARMEFIRTDKQYKRVPNGSSKFSFEMKYFDKFRKKFPEYEYELEYNKRDQKRNTPIGFAVWGIIIEREVNESQYLFSKLNEVEEV